MRHETDPSAWCAIGVILSSICGNCANSRSTRDANCVWVLTVKGRLSINTPGMSGIVSDRGRNVEVCAVVVVVVVGVIYDCCLS